MACGCNKGRSAAGGLTASGTGTHSVLVSGRQVYESGGIDAALSVAGRFELALIFWSGSASAPATYSAIVKGSKVYEGASKEEAEAEGAAALEKLKASQTL